MSASAVSRFMDVSKLRSQHPGSARLHLQVLFALETEPEQTRAVQQRVGVEHQAPRDEPYIAGSLKGVGAAESQVSRTRGRMMPLSANEHFHD